MAASSASFLAQRLPRWWYGRGIAPALLPLAPLSWVFRSVVAARRRRFLADPATAGRLPVPVIVVGNLTVGGSGKTPVVLWLVERLRAAGWRPGVISRGYGAASDGPRAAQADDAAASGDEPALLARRSGAPVFVGRDRVAAGEALLQAHPDCNLIIADDGLQHYRLQRDVEIAVFDSRGAGNGHLLPLGPLREPLTRLAGCTAVVWNGAPESGAARAAAGLPQFAMRLQGASFRSLVDPAQRCGGEAFAGKRLYALAGIGDPQRFFRHLEALGLRFSARPFADHHAYCPDDLAFASDGVLLMTEKDAVKCASFYAPSGGAPAAQTLPGLPEAWALPVDADIAAAPGSPGLLDLILEKLNGRTPA